MFQSNANISERNISPVMLFSSGPKLEESEDVARHSVCLASQKIAICVVIVFCGKCYLWEMLLVGNVLVGNVTCGKCYLWEMLLVGNVTCGKCYLWEMFLWEMFFVGKVPHPTSRKKASDPWLKTGNTWREILKLTFQTLQKSLKTRN
jgi:hypothetical protein